MSEAVALEDRIAGAMLGLAVGDALGLPVEFEPKSVRDGDPVKDLRPSDIWKLPAGTWSDDTSLALCLAESICEKGFDPEDAGGRFLAWLDKGHWSATGEAFDVGGATRRALDRVRTGVPATLSGGRGENDNGNGSLMRILPASLWLASLPEPARVRAVAAYSAITHGHPRSLLGCYLHCLVSARLLAGDPPLAAYESAMEEACSRLDSLPLALRSEERSYRRVLDGSLVSASAASIRGSGYVVHCLEASLWCLVNSGDYRSCVLQAVNLGEDSDTTGAVAGGLAGLAYGRGSIPEAWIVGMARSSDIHALSRRLAALVGKPAPLPRSYWILPGKFLAGGYPGRGDPSQGPASTEAAVKALLAAGIDAFVDLSAEGEDVKAEDYRPFLGSAVLSRHMPLPDMSADPAAVRRVLSEVEALLAAGRSVYLHCVGGFGRTGTLVGTYLVDAGLASPTEALQLLEALRSGTDRPGTQSPQTEEQRRLVLSTIPGPAALVL